MKKLIVDLDDTLSSTMGGDYEQAVPRLEVIRKLHEYRAMGFEIAINTSRNMRSYGGNIGKITAYTLPVIVDWLRRHEVPYDEIYIGKPWCGHEGFYVDDRAIRPSEFVDKSFEEISAMLVREK